MTFDNSKTIIRSRIRLFVATVLFLAYLLLAFAANIIKFPLLGMDEATVTIILTAVYLIIVFIPMALSYQYIYYSDEGNLVIFRYFYAGIVGGKKNSIEIQKSTFSGYTLEKKLLGLSQSIILYQQIKGGKAKYPPIYISALTKADKEKVFRSLNMLLHSR
jgi:hypothetical protein